MNQTTITSGRTAPPVPDLIHQLRAQRIRISALSRKSGALRDRGRDLLAKSKSLAAGVEQSWTDLAIACLQTRSAVQNFASTALPGTAALRFQSPPQVCPSSFLRIRRTWSRRSNRPRKFSKWSSPAPKAAGSIRSSSVRGSSSGPAQPVQSNFRFISSVTGRPFYNDEPPGSSQPNPSGTDKLCVADCRPPASYDWGVGGTLGHD